MAVSLTSAQLQAALGIDDAVSSRLLGVASVLVNRYAPGAPVQVQNESTIRTAGYLNSMPKASVRSESEGEVTTDYAVTHLSALRHSGGMALLSPWKIRRAGAI